MKQEFKLGRTAKQFKRALAVLKNFKGRAKLIDIGAEGKLLKNFLPENIEYYSLDCKKGDYDYIVDLDKQKIPVEDQTFDIIVCLEVLEHVSSPRKLMSEIIRIGKRDAIFILSMPNEYNFIQRIYHLFGKITEFDEPFMLVEKHLHIHKPRVKDILSFFPKFIRINTIDYYWQSKRSSNNNLVYILDIFIDKLAKILPSLFSRGVVISGKKK